MTTLSWDLHLHPGPSSVPRWGDGRRVQAAARAAGVRGFVWKSHERHTHELCSALPPGPPHAIASASLNPWASPADVLTAVDAGALWVWGPTCDADGANAWELPLPAWWEELWPELARRRLVLATGHLDAAGRRRFAEACAGLPEVTCSLTHSLFLADGEVEALAATGCAFELDCYTRTVAIPGHTAAPVARRASRIRELGCLVHLTSDGGQASTSDPFRFAAAELEKLRPECGDELVYALAREGPERLAARLGLGDGHDRGDT